MKQEMIMDALNMLADDITEETGRLRREKGTADAVKGKSGNRKWRKLAAAAACFAVIFYVGARLFSTSTAEDSGGRNLSRDTGSEKNPSHGTGGDTGELPMLTVTEKNQSDMGFEGYLAFDISDLVNDNPWSEDEDISSLPVFENRLEYRHTTGKMTGGDFDKMEALLLETAEHLGLDTATLEITDDTLDEARQEVVREKFASSGEEVPEGYFDPSALIARKEGMELEVSEAMTVTVRFEEKIDLPGEYAHMDDDSYEDMAAVADYFKETYSSLIAMKAPRVDIYGGDYDIDRNQSYHLAFYDGNGDFTERFLNYSFNRTEFYTEDGRLWMIRIFRPDLSCKAGDYPVITAAEARELLVSGNYLTTVPYEMPGEEYVAKTELVYRTSEIEEYYMPYYRFYVELPAMEREQGLKSYGAYYVPAVEEAYISNMPVWDGRFN